MKDHSGKYFSLAARSAVWRMIGLCLVLSLAGPAALSQEPAPAIYATTGVQTDLAISGPGYFVLLDPATGFLLASRQGVFRIDAQGYMVDRHGMRLQGYSDPSLTEIGDVLIDAGTPDLFMISMQFAPNGCILVTRSDGSEIVRSQILLQNFSAPRNLIIWPWGGFKITEAAQPLPTPIAPGSAGLGNLLAGTLESPVPVIKISPITATTPGTNQGFLTDTGISTDFAIQGRGYFLVRDTNSSQLFATRAGAFYQDRNGYLVNYAGMRMQGWTEGTNSTSGDLAVNTVGLPITNGGAPVMGYDCDWMGHIGEWLDDGSRFVCGQILLTDCAHPEQLARTNFGLYSMTPAAGPWSSPCPPASNDLGLVLSGSVELQEFDDLILETRRHLNFFVQGPITTTSRETDLAIGGNGFFTLRDPGLNLLCATRTGAFHLEPSGYLVNSNGLRLQGFNDPALSQQGDLIIDAAGAPSGADPAAVLSCFVIDGLGKIVVLLSDGTRFTRGQILLQNYRDLQALMPVGEGIYTNLDSAGPLNPAGTPCFQSPGRIYSGALEQPSTIASLHLPPTAGLRLEISSLMIPAILESSEDLHSWLEVGPVSSSVMGEAEFFETSPQPPAKFFRLKVSVDAPQVLSTGNP